MIESLQYKRYLRVLCNYRALVTARRYLLAVLLILTFYATYLGISLVPFYLTVMLAILPSLLLGAVPGEKTSDTPLPILQQKLQYSKRKHFSMKITFYITIALLALWNIRYLKLDHIGPILKYTPAILIISALTIYTIGQYYYFARFHRSIMQNELYKIK